jgi:hypothetical protein
MLVNEFNDYDEMNAFIKDEKDLFFTSIVKSISNAIENDFLRIVIAHFTILKTEEIFNITIQRNDWSEMLNLALYHFESTENYEYCSEINDLINQLSDE